MKRETIKSMGSHLRQNWGTPKDFFGWVHACFRFTVDASAEPWNAKLRRYWTKEDNGLAQPWRRQIAWNNPEYEKVQEWLRHAKHEARMGGVSANLTSNRPDTEWYREATEHDAGRLVRSYFVPETRVWWLLWSELVVGVYGHDQRLVFDVPPGTLNKKGQPMEKDPAMFPSALIIFAARGRHRLVDVEPARQLRPRGWKWARPHLLYGMPE